MSYTRKVIGDNERLVLITGPHWIYIIQAIFWGCMISAIGFVMDYFVLSQATYEGISSTYYYEVHHYNSFFTKPSFLTTCTGIAIALVLYTKYLSTEIGLTDRRIIHKWGVFKIEVQQVELEDIRGEIVHHGWLGWLLGYGRIRFDCRFIDDIFLPATRDPYKLVKAVHTARMRSEKIPHYDVGDLEKDIIRIDQQRIEAFKAREKLKRMALLAQKDFNKAKDKR